jgi:hypothetical protein
MLQMNEPQVWTLIGVFAAATFGTMTLISTMFVRVLKAEVGGLRAEVNGSIDGLRSEIGGLRGEMNGAIGGLRAEIGGLRGEMNARFDAVDHRFEAVDRRFDYLDTDVQALTKRVMGDQA